MSGIQKVWKWAGSVALVAILLIASVPVLSQDEAQSDAPEIVVQIAIGADVDRAGRVLIDPRNEFAAGEFSADAGQVYCLTRVMNLDASETVTHVWYHEGKTKARVELKVGSADWRTWSSKRILPAWTGDWEVKVLDVNGMVLASAGFVVN